MKCKTVLVQAIVFAFILGIMVTGTEDAFAASLTIVNPSFEDPVLANGAFTVNPGVGVPGWTDFISGPTGVFNPSSAAGHYTTEEIIPDGANVAYSNGGFFCQILSDTLQTNTKYTLDVDVGKRNDGVPTLKRFTIDFRAAIIGPPLDQDTLAGVDSGVPAAPRIAATVPASDSFATNTIMFETGDSHPREGQSLLICISIFGSGAQVNFDNVRLDASSVTPEPDHYLGYDAKIPKGEPKFLKFTVELSDQFETATYTVDKPARLYNPVIKNAESEQVSDEISHYVGYKIKTPKDAPKFETVTNVLVQNQFGDIIVDVKKPKLLLVPSAKDHSPTPDPLESITVNHFKCYDVKVSKDTLKFEKLIVLLDDPNFGITQEFEVKKPKMLCTPVDKDGEGIVDPENHLMCYDIKKLMDDPKFEKLSVFTNNQFGPEDLEVKKQKELCVPSVKILSP